MSGDSPELEALFDSIAYREDPLAAQDEKTNADSPELEALFDSISEAVDHADAPRGVDAWNCPEHVYAKLGQMTRSLHNLLRELGLDTAIKELAQEIPNNRERLNYVATMSAQAAERALTAAENAQPIQRSLGETAKALAAQWDRLFDKQLSVNEFKLLVQNTHNYLRLVPSKTEATNTQLMEIIMAQDFQDLTGQVIKKVLDAAQNLEGQLLALLLETMPEVKRQAVRTDLLAGPATSAAGREDIVTNQEQVDELLESLGF